MVQDSWNRQKQIKSNRETDTKMHRIFFMVVMAMHRALHSQSNIDRLYIPWNNGERGISVTDCVAMEMRSWRSM